MVILMPFLCVPLSLLHWVTLGTISIVKELWMTLSAGGPHSSFQPIIQMESAIHAGSLQVSFLSLRSPGQVCSVSRAEHLSRTSHGSRVVICCRGSATWKRTWLSCVPKTTKSHKASGVRCSGCYRGGNDGREGFYQWGIVLSSQEWESVSICHFERQLSEA